MLFGVLYLKIASFGTLSKLALYINYYPSQLPPQRHSVLWGIVIELAERDYSNSEHSQNGLDQGIIMVPVIYNFNCMSAI